MCPLAATPTRTPTPTRDRSSRHGAKRDHLDHVEPGADSPVDGDFGPTADGVDHVGRARTVERTESSCRPPWFETTMPSTPASTERRASSGSSTDPDHQPAVEVLTDPRDVIRGGARFELGRNHALNAARMPARGTASSRLPKRKRPSVDDHIASPAGVGRYVEPARRAEPRSRRCQRPRCGRRADALLRPPGPLRPRAPPSGRSALKRTGRTNTSPLPGKAPSRPVNCPTATSPSCSGHVPERLRTDGIDDRGAPRSVRDPRARAECPSRTADLTQHAP